MTRFMPGLALVGGLLALAVVVADEGVKTFVVQEGHLSANVRELAGSHGWTLVWDSEEDRIIKRSFHVPNPSLEECLSDVLAGYENVFTANLDQAERVVYVTTAAGAYAGEASGSGENGLQWSNELDFEPDLKPASLPEPPPYEEQELTVRMLDVPQPRKNDESEPDASASTPETGLKLLEVPPPEKPESPAIALDSKAGTLPKETPASDPARPVLQILSMKDRGKAESELAKLQALGHDVFLEEFRQDDMLWHRLKMRVSHAEGIEDTVKTLEGLGYKTVWVLPHDPAQKQSSSGE